MIIIKVSIPLRGVISNTILLVLSDSFSVRIYQNEEQSLCYYFSVRERDLVILPPDIVHDMYICVVQWHEVSHCHTYGRYRVRYIHLLYQCGGQQTPSTTCKYLRARESNLAILPPDNSVHVMYICVVQWHEVSQWRTI